MESSKARGKYPAATEASVRDRSLPPDIAFMTPLIPFQSTLTSEPSEPSSTKISNEDNTLSMPRYIPPHRRGNTFISSQNTKSLSDNRRTLPGHSTACEIAGGQSSGDRRVGVVRGNPDDSNPNYKGSHSLVSDQSADIPDEQNVSFWMKNLSPGCTTKTLLEEVRDIGKVSHSSVTPPNGAHTTSAARLEFFDRESADRFLDKAHSGIFTVQGYVPRVTRNRIKVAALPESQISRVLVISRPVQVVSRPYHQDQFDLGENFKYDLHEVTVQSEDTTTRTLEFHFASARAQAGRARAILEELKQHKCGEGYEELDAWWGHIKCHWGFDPCQ
ncbi:Uu.00g027130.m01.CDS01 [Anthostomella pinea]|uniref:Uu.00g027130.m01.CDS01 n=1 Tax=Anthostomella pinea TaxID=933095 RepID=A0AAI8YCM4_9PEZI|nr:Uu.00g027130.m01.CDS01 [Anthostomella pinea]